MGRPRPGKRLSALVLHSNEMVSKVTLLQIVICAFFMLFCLEQPASSLMKCHDRLAELQRQLGDSCYHCFTWMKAYGGRTPKPTQLLGNCHWIPHMYRPCSSNKTADPRDKTAVVHQNKRGKRAFTGNKAALQNSQVYPKAYGRAHAREYSEWDKAGFVLPKSDDYPDSDESLEPDGKDVWSDADPEPICKLLGVPCDRLITRLQN
jgi:hypothetical protein